MRIELEDFMAKACHYAQEHVDDPEAWKLEDRELYFTCVSYQMACFFAQNTVEGEKGVESNIILDELCCYLKSEKKWKQIIRRIAKEFGGWKETEKYNSKEIVNVCFTYPQLEKKIKGAIKCSLSYQKIPEDKLDHIFNQVMNSIIKTNGIPPELIRN